MNSSIDRFEFESIGTLSTCFKEKFGIPRQPGLVAEAIGILTLKSDPFMINAVKELDSFSHVWLVFVFHQNGSKGWKPSIRPPRLGGAKKVGVLASRSPHRPNPIGISAVKLDRIVYPRGGSTKGNIKIYLSGVDILDGTPVLDVKPYLPYADSLADANAGWAEQEIERVPVRYSKKALEAIAERTSRSAPNLKELITSLLELDPRPAFQKRQTPHDVAGSEGAQYGFRVLDYDVKWEIRGGQYYVLDVVDFV